MKRNLWEDLKRIKAERVARGLMQDDMAERLVWGNRARYAKRENGIVPLGVDELAQIVSIFKMDKDDIGIVFTTNVPNKER